MSDTGPAQADERVRAFVGRVISDRYRVQALIAEGGMGAVFRGEHLRLRKRVAIKILHAEMEGILELAEQFEREAIAGAHITHPNVAIATDFGRLDDGSFFLIEEYLRGETLADLLTKGPLSVDRALHIAKQMAAALQAVHAMKIVHRDFKPSNVMLIQGTEDQAKLIDFGFARVPMERMSVAQADDPLHDKDGMWDPDTVFGTVGYLAPEAAKGVDAIDARSDLYALGVTMYEMLTGKRPFEAPTNAELFRCHLTEPPPPFVERAPLVPIPAALEGVVMKLLAKDPAQRYQSGDEIVAALNRIVAAKPTAFPQQPRVTVEDLAIPPPPRSRLPRVIVAVLVLGLLGAVAWLVPSVRTQLRQWGVPVPAGSASSVAAAEASTIARPEEVDGLGAAAWAARLLAAPKKADWSAGSKALSALAELDPGALRADELAKAAAAVANGAASSPADAPTAKAVFDMLARRFGSDGLDVLHRITDMHPANHPTTKRATSLLAQPEILARATPSLTVAVELAAAPCEQKVSHFEHAAAVGDARALKVLKLLRASPCRTMTDACCFRTNQALATTIRTLEERLRQP